MDDNRLDEILSQFKNNPSIEKEWEILKSLDAGIAVDFDIPPEQTDGIKAKCNSILKDAINEVDAEASSEQPKIFKKQQRKKIWAVAAIAASLIIMFFTFTSSGRAIARSIYETVVTFFGGEIHMEMQIPEGSVPEKKDFESETFTSLDEASEFLKYPLIGISNDSVSIDRVVVEYNGLVYTIETAYSTTDGHSFFVGYEIETRPDFPFTLDGDSSGDEAFEHKLFNGQTMYCNTTANDHCMGLAMWDNVMLSVVSDNMSWDQLLIYIDKLESDIQEVQ